MKNLFALAGALFTVACTIPPKDPFVAAERAVRRNDLLRALRAYDAVPVAHPRYPDARAAAGDIEQSMRRCHELILEALMLRGQWRDEEALEALRRAGDHWPNQPSLPQWIAATEQRLRLFEGRSDTAETEPGEHVPAAVPLFEVASDGERKAAARRDGANEIAIEIPSTSVPEPMLPRSAKGSRTEQGPPTSSVEVLQLSPSGRRVGAANVSQDDPVGEPPAKSPGSSHPAPSSQGDRESAAGRKARSRASADSPALATPKPGSAAGKSAVADPPKRLVGRGASAGRVPKPSTSRKTVRPNANGEDPVALGLVAVEVRLGRGELPAAVRDLIELARRFPEDVRVNRRLGRLLNQRALMHYGQGAVAAAIADWRRVLALEPGNESVRVLLARAVAESERR